MRYPKPVAGPLAWCTRGDARQAGHGPSSAIGALACFLAPTCAALAYLKACRWAPTRVPRTTPSPGWAESRSTAGTEYTLTETGRERRESVETWPALADGPLRSGCPTYRPHRTSGRP